MLAQFIQRLTLFAFTAHAVMGCCWHHSHAVGNNCCAGHVEHVVENGEVASVDYHHNGHSSHDGHSHHEHDGDSAGQADCDHGVATFQAICSDCPDHHSHDCDEDRCSYVAVKLQLLDLGLNSGFVERVCCDTNLFAVACGISSGRFYDGPVLARAVSSVQRCACLQSWQI